MSSVGQIPPVVADLSSTLQIASIRLLQSSCELNGEAFVAGAPEPTVDNLGMDIATSGGRVVLPQPFLMSKIGLTVRLLSNGRLVATLSGTWLVAYSAPSAEALSAITDDLAMSFNTLVAPRAVWPFAREFFASLCWRMMLQPAILPGFNPAIVFPDFYQAGLDAAERHNASLQAQKA